MVVAVIAGLVLVIYDGRDIRNIQLMLSLLLWTTIERKREIRFTLYLCRSVIETVMIKTSLERSQESFGASFIGENEGKRIASLSGNGY